MTYPGPSCIKAGWCSINELLFKAFSVYASRLAFFYLPVKTTGYSNPALKTEILHFLFQFYETLL